MSTETTSVIWEEPSTVGRAAQAGPPDWAATLIANPNRWARVQKFDSPGRAGGAATALKTNGWVWIRTLGGKWDAASRSINGEYWLYACYLGQNETQAGGQ